jgi:hypothetical protein
LFILKILACFETPVTLPQPHQKSYTEPVPHKIMKLRSIGAEAYEYTRLKPCLRNPEQQDKFLHISSV